MRACFSVLAAAFLTVVGSAGPSLAGPAPVQIPEPSTIALVAAGAAVVAWAKFRRKR
jgi:hypothetical protein